MKNILVTGGCGFIASNFLNYVLEKYPNYLFVNIDALYYCADEKNITENNRKNENYKFVKGNINDTNLLLLLQNLTVIKKIEKRFNRHFRKYIIGYEDDIIGMNYR